MNKFFYNTGIPPNSIPFFAYERYVNMGYIIEHTIIAPFECMAEPDYILLYLSSYKNLYIGQGIRVYEIFNTPLSERYAYFRIPNVKLLDM